MAALHVGVKYGPYGRFTEHSCLRSLACASRNIKDHDRHDDFPAMVGRIPHNKPESSLAFDLRSTLQMGCRQ
jgi:hypothetical protein